MNHDIAHCNKQDCPKKDNCYRYQAHLEAKELGLPYVSYFILEDEDINEDGSCDHWWNKYKQI